MLPYQNGPLLPVPTLMSHTLPLWFLVLALFLPRIALLGAWLQGVLAPFHLDTLFSPLAGVVVPRLLVLFLIYQDQGVDQWFEAHAVVAIFVILGFAHRRSQRDQQVQEIVVRRRRPIFQQYAQRWRM
jgi:hypothetical protein